MSDSYEKRLRGSCHDGFALGYWVNWLRERLSRRICSRLRDETVERKVITTGLS